MDSEAPTPVERMGADVRRCTATTKAHQPCPRAVQPGTALCWTHGTPLEVRRVISGRRDPKVAASADHADLAARIQAAADPPALAAVLAEVAAGVLAGTITPKAGAVVCSLGKAALEALRQARTDRLKEIEAALEAHPQLSGVTRRRR